jgi:glutamate N-acetyltransferase/amino-acid N-acetyltransferase
MPQPVKTETCPVAGFRFAGVSAGLKQATGVKDLGLIVAERPVAAAGAFTTNLVQAAPVKLARERLKAGRIQAVLVNSGSANCFTGKAGERLAESSCAALAREIGCSAKLVVPCSTGVIGQLYSLERLRRGLMAACRELRAEGADDFARAIMTTDTRTKTAYTSLKLDRRRITLLGIAKGAGMIAPAMATMLAFIITDAAVGPSALRRALRRAVKSSFDAITIDGDMSTNDTVLLLASGAGASGELTDRALTKFEAALGAVCQSLARQIVYDGEGATKLAAVEVSGARSQADANAVARRIANSPLVKTALFGCDPNVGRILAAAGASGVRFDPERLVLRVGGVTVAARGRVIVNGLDQARRVMSRRELELKLDLRLGSAKATVVTSDLSFDYVRINAEYTS